jgi:hypothetical protein
MYFLTMIIRIPETDKTAKHIWGLYTDRSTSDDNLLDTPRSCLALKSPPLPDLAA